MAFGVLAGIGWSALNLWCLKRALGTWLGAPSRRHTVGWFLVKFPLLYALLVGLLMTPGLSAIGFGIGLLIALAAAVIVFLLNAQRASQSAGHGG